MNFVNVYKHATGEQEKVETQEKGDSKLLETHLDSWRIHPITRELIKYINRRSDRVLAAIRSVARNQDDNFVRTVLNLEYAVCCDILEDINNGTFIEKD